LLGMVATLRGTGMALESSTDLEAIRASLAAPVKGLGFAFGTSIAGVAASAMLGLLSALCRRERIGAGQMLDVKIASALRIYSQTHQREETFKLLQRQAEVMPALVDRLQAMMATIERQSLAMNEQQIAAQNAFHGRTEAAYMRLAANVEQSLKSSVADSARAASVALKPVMEATMAGLARETAALHDTVTHAVQRQLDGLSTGFEETTTTVANIWSQALAGQQRSNEALTEHLRGSLDRFTETFEQRSAGLLDGVSARLDATAGRVSEAWSEALTRQEQVSEKLASHNEQALAAAAATFEQHSASLLRTVGSSHADLQTELASRDQQRLAAWTETLGSMAATLSREWEQAGARTASRQQEMSETLAQTARDISAQTQAHASNTITEIDRLVQAASEAPKAAANLQAELRQKLSESMARDTAMLSERSRLLATVETLLDAVNHASTEQRSAVDALVTTTADLLDRVGTQFADKVELETGKLGTVAAQVTGSAVEVASLGDAFGAAVQVFGESNDKLVAHLQRIEAALDKSLARSDEQLAYYVAQAREVIDLSMMSQKQIVEDLQRLAGQRASAGVEAA
jgi:DNA polymerase III gamma/tau subunit